jgi:DNA-binding TFAR19-related protein (PDSD5 family)
MTDLVTRARRAARLPVRSGPQRSYSSTTSRRSNSREWAAFAEGFFRPSAQPDALLQTVADARARDRLARIRLGLPVHDWEADDDE